MVGYDTKTKLQFSRLISSQMNKNLLVVVPDKVTYHSRNPTTTMLLKPRKGLQAIALRRPVLQTRLGGGPAATACGDPVPSSGCCTGQVNYAGKPGLCAPIINKLNKPLDVGPKAAIHICNFYEIHIVNFLFTSVITISPFYRNLVSGIIYSASSSSPTQPFKTRASLVIVFVARLGNCAWHGCAVGGNVPRRN